MNKEYFDALVRDREESAKTLEKYSMRGTKSSVVDKYSEQAHFVYELLQNADDANATYASFILYHNRLVFIHNGTRHFSVSNPETEKEDGEKGLLGDVNAITAVGASSKVEGNTIGKFGIGFKAVFQYTASPSVYDCEIAFRIERFIVPVLLEKDHHMRKKEETLFEFPFNHETTTPETAFEEISERLTSLVNPTLFLSNLQEIRFEFDDTIGIYTKETVKSYPFNDTKAEKIILKQTINEETTNSQLWLFSRIDEGNGRYAVGFYLDEKGDLIPVDEYAYCFFPTKVRTGLHFILHAPFLLTDSREGIKKGEAHNQHMLNLLSVLAADSLSYIVEIGKTENRHFLNDSILDVIPTASYEETDWIGRNNFKPFFDKIQSAFWNKRIIPTKESYTTSDNAYWSKIGSISELFNTMLLRELTGNSNADWAFPSVSREKYTDYIESILPEVFPNYYGDYEDEVAHIIDEDTLIKLVTPSFIQNRDVKWLERFYKWINDSGKRRDAYKTKPIFLDKYGKAVPAYNDQHYLILFFPSDFESDYITVHEDLWNNEKIRAFMESYGITKPSLKDEIYNKILPELNRLPKITRQKTPYGYISGSNPNQSIPVSVETAIKHFKKLFGYYLESNRAEQREFIAELKKYDCLVCFSAAAKDKYVAHQKPVIYFPTDELMEYFEVKPSTCFVDWESYLDLIGNDQEESLHEFLSKLGVSGKVEICKQSVDNPYQKYNYSWTETRNPWINKWEESFIDGCSENISNIESILDHARSVELWNILLSLIKGGINLVSQLLVVHTYYYYIERSEDKDALDIIELRNRNWLFSKSGRQVSPGTVFATDLMEDYDITSMEARKLIDFLKMTYEDPQLSKLTPAQRADLEFAKQMKNAGITTDDLEGFLEYKRQKARSVSVQSERGNDVIQPETTGSEFSDEGVDSSATKLRKPRTYTPEPEDDDDSDEYTPTPVDYQKKIQNARAKFDAEKDLIEQLEELQQKAISAKRYSFGWFKALLELEISASRESTGSTSEFSISFGRVELDSTSNNSRTLILRHPDRGIPPFVEELTDIPLILEFEKESVKLLIENISIKSYSLRVRVKQDVNLTNFSFSEVKEARITAQNPVFLLDELKKQFAGMEYEDAFDMQKNLCSNIEFIFGPPGTGKTTHLASEVIIPIMKQNDRCRVLVLTPTNKAADVITEKIMEIMGDDMSYKEWLVRFGTTNTQSILDAGLLKDKTFDLKSLARIVLITTIDRFPYDFWMNDDSSHYLRNQNYDYIIFDEASMIPLYKIIYPLYHRLPKKFIIAGDPFQIEPVIQLDMWKDENIYKMVRLNSFSSPKTRPHVYDVKLLTTQYRSIPLIGELFSRMTYDGVLTHYRRAEDQTKIDFGDFPDVKPFNLIKFPVSKYESVYRAKRLGKSPYHIYSALFAYEFAVWLHDTIIRCNPEKTVRLGIIAPYKAQADLIGRLIETNFKSDMVEIQANTIHGFQGDECEIIIAVYNPPPGMSDSKKGFLNKKNIINVSISRARDYLFILMPDDNTEKVENLRLIEQMEHYIKETEQYTEYSSCTIEQLMFGKPDYLENNSFSTAHQNVNVYGVPEQIYEIRSEDSAIDIQIHKKD